MSRATIPPTGLPPGLPGHETLDVLQHKLQLAEGDTKQLMDTLAQMGFNTDSKGNVRMSNPETVKPFSARSGSSDAVHKNYEALVSRVCKTESAVQTLKMNLLRAQAERDLSKQEKATANEKLCIASEGYEKEIKRLNKELSNARKDCKDSFDVRRSAEENIRKLQHALDDATSTKTEIAAASENLNASKQKLLRRNNELKDELTREASLRRSLEESHSTLLSRIHEMEQLVESEREEVKTLNALCSHLKSESMKSKEIVKKENELRVKIEHKLVDTHKKKEHLNCTAGTLQEDKDLLISELKKMQSAYLSLNGQLDEMRNLIEDRQKSDILKQFKYYKGTSEQLEKENKRLYEAMKASAAQNAQLVSKYEQELNDEKASSLKTTATEETVKELQHQLKEEIRVKNECQTQWKHFETKTNALEKELGDKKNELKTIAKEAALEIAKLKKSIETLTEAKEKALREKEGLLDEVNQAVDGMSDERTRLEADLEGAKLEIQTLQKTKTQLEQEHARLHGRITSMEDQQSAASQIESSMTDILEQKSKLAYDKGRLQDRVEQLQRELESLATTQGELNQLRKVSSALEAKYNKVVMELNNYKMSTQQLESQLNQAKNSSERKEKDFQMAIKARDDAVRESQRLLGHIEALQERDQQKVKGLENNLCDARHDNKKIATTLESIMSSHSQLQATIEDLQIQQGKKDSQINSLKNDKDDFEQKLRQSQREFDALQAKLLSMEDLETSELEPLRRSLQKCNDDNVKMAASMEMLLTSNNQMQGSMQHLQDELEKKQHLTEKIKRAREKDQEQQKSELKTYEERLDNLKQQLMKERDKTVKRTNKEVTEVRKQIEDSLGKNGNLSRTNTELRHKVTELEFHQKEMKDKISSLKSQIEHLTRVRQKQDQQLESMQAISDQLSKLEHTKNEYVRKNKDQAKTMQNFMAQIASLQGEIRTLATAHLDTTAIMQTQEDQLTKERKYAEDIKAKYRKAKQREERLESLRKQTEEKLREANNESLMISSNLQDAHEWFKTKFDGLQTELTQSKLSQAEVERDNSDTRHLLLKENKRAEETADRAKAMIRASRETITRLANFAELSQQQAQQQLIDMRKQVDSEKGKSARTEKKLHHFQESSLRMTEELARELDTVKSRSSTFYDSGDSYS